MDRLDADGKPASFDVKFVTMDLKRGTGGEIIEVKGVRKTVGKRNGVAVMDTRERQTPAEERERRNPNHFLNSTRNILLPNGELRKLHIRLIIEFNGKKVCF